MALADRIPLVDLEELRSLGDNLPWGIGRRRILGLLFAAPKWDALLNILTSLRDREPAAVALARDRLARWMAQFNRRSSPLAPAHQQRLRREIQALAMELPPERMRLLTFLVGLQPRYSVRPRRNTERCYFFEDTGSNSVRRLTGESPAMPIIQNTMPEEPPQKSRPSTGMGPKGRR